MRLETAPFGPFTKGVIDRAEASLPLTGAARALTNVRFTGANRLAIRSGTRVVLTCKDDQGSPATVTDICAIVPFADGCLIVGHSTVTSKAYLYRLNATLTTWTDSSGSPHTTASPEPVGVLWSSIPNAPEVSVAEGLGLAYICHTAALDASSLAFPMQSFTDSTRAIATVTSDLDNDTAAESLYFTGCVSFQQHLWAFGFGTGTTASDAFRPELARFSQPNFATAGGLFRTPDSLTLGHRVRSQREGIVGGFVAGNALFLGAPYLVSRITGYGRSSWFKQPLDSSYGFVNQKCGVAVGSVLYYWSPRGPMRVTESGDAEPLFDAIANLVESVVSPQTVVASFDSQTDTVLFAFDTGDGVRTWAGYDVRRELWIGPDNDFGVTLRAMGAVSPIYTPTAAATLGPTAAPSGASTTDIGATTAKANWTAGDLTSPTLVQYRQQGASSWSVGATVSAGVATYTFTGLTPDVDYEWRAAHQKDGQTSSDLGPSGSTQFTTLASDAGLQPPTGVSVVATDAGGTALDEFSIDAYLRVSWTNSGESGVSTDVESSDDGTNYSVQQTAAPGVASASIRVTASGTYAIRLRHTKPSYTSSSYTTPVSTSVSITS